MLWVSGSFLMYISIHRSSRRNSLWIWIQSHSEAIDGLSFAKINILTIVIKIVWKRQHQKCNTPVILHFQDCLKWSLPNPRVRLHSGNQGLSFLEINWEKPRKWEITVWRIPVTGILRNGSLSSTEQPRCLKKSWKTGWLTFRGVGADPRQAGFPGNYLGACLFCSYKIVLKKYRWKMNWIKPRWCCLARPVSTGWSVKNICFRD